MNKVVRPARWTAVVATFLVISGGCQSSLTLSLPTGAHWIPYKLASSLGPLGAGEGIEAATSLSAIRAIGVGLPKVTQWEQCAYVEASPPECWSDASPRTGLLYVAVSVRNICMTYTDDAMAVGGHTLYFVHGVGHQHGVCTYMMALPTYTLFTVEAASLPSTGWLEVELVIQDTDSGTSIAAQTSVLLG